MSVPLRVTLLIFLALIGTFLSGLLLLQHHNANQASTLVSMMCGDDASGGCTAVNRSEYSKLLGIPVAALGLIFYLSLALLGILIAAGSSHIRSVGLTFAFYAITFGLVTDLALLATQMFVIKAYCTMCIATYGAGTVLFAILLKHRKLPAPGALQMLLAGSEGKTILIAWIFGLLMIAGAVWAVNLAIVYQDPRGLESRLLDAAIEEFEREPVRSLSTQGAPSQGSVTAPLQIVIYSDFLCPWCRQIALALEQHLPQWGDRVAVYYRNYPLDGKCNSFYKTEGHPGACWAALAGICAQEQGLFWQFHNLIFEKPPSRARGMDFVNVGAEVGTDTTAMKACMTSGLTLKRLQDEIAAGHDVGVSTTPRIFINGRMVQRLVYFNAILRSEAKRLAVPPLEGLDE